ncbi:threonylcarbamoyl-AMP synthase [bacterium]|nr:threonylcarbamoyl-AMP synthase [bacterium]
MTALSIGDNRWSKKNPAPPAVRHSRPGWRCSVRPGFGLSQLRRILWPRAARSRCPFGIATVLELPLGANASVSTDSLISTDVARAAELLREGRLVAIATETVYGLGANALDERAVARVFEVKNRPHFDPLIVHIADGQWLARLVTDVPAAARQLADAFWPGPLTLVLPKSNIVPDLVTSGLPRVAIRMPSHPQALELLWTVDLPIAAPSANPFGQLSPTTAEHVAATLGDGVDLILDGGPCSIGVESTVIGFDDGAPCILRQGGLTQEEIEQVVGPVQSRQNPASGPPESPGMLPQHYAPRTPLTTTESADLTAGSALHQSLAGQRVGLLLLEPAHSLISGFEAIEVLTTDGNLREAAASFFAALRRLDAAGLDQILALPFPDEGLGRALNDRLHRACHR